MNNIILITIDTLRKDILGLYNPSSNLSPFIDSLKDNCSIFTNAYATGPYTQTSFQGILTSSYYLEYGKEKSLNKDKVLISEVLKNNNIYTAGFHSNAYLSYFFGYNKGWDIFYDSMKDSVTDMYPFIRGYAINKKVAEFLSAFSFSKPLFLWVHYMDVHEPYIAEDKYLNKIDTGINLSKEEMFSLFKNTLLPRDISDTGKVSILKKLYMAKVAETDDYIKELFGILSSHNLIDNSTIIITSDHGDEFGEHSGLSHDGKMYNELLNIPLFIYDKTYKQTKIDTPVSLIDISPTICALFDTEPSQAFKGKSLFSSVSPHTLYGEAIGKIGHKEKDSDMPVYYLLEDNLKLIYKEEDSIWQAYDIKNDPTEKINIISKVNKELKDKLINFINRKR
ncbi:MAG: sulfatase [Actinobacteria bacterium]|nr:sulfatase [Actinomycetota bacterium]MCL5771707.1 sulfatase [Actinomycetota bacterium]